MTLSAIIYGDRSIQYRVNIDERRSARIAIHVDPDGAVVVDAPPGFDDAAIQQAVQKRARWVASHVDEAKARYANICPREYVSGEEIKYLGRNYVLKVMPVDKKPGPVRLNGNRLIVETKSVDPEDIKGRVRGWYRAKARDYFIGKVDYLADRLPWVDKVPPVRLLSMEKQWGSCSPSGRIILNPHLIKAPRECIEYVIIHELAHLKHHDHGPDFQKLIDIHVPDWRKTKRQLDAMVEVVMAY